MTALAYPSGLARSLSVVNLQVLVDLLAPMEVHRFRQIGVEGLTCNSNEVTAGSVFFAIRGTRKNGGSSFEEAWSELIWRRVRLLFAIGTAASLVLFFVDRIARLDVQLPSRCCPSS